MLALGIGSVTATFTVVHAVLLRPLPFQEPDRIIVRLALGASRGDIIRVTAGRGLALAAAGVALGLTASAGATRLLETVLFDVSPTDPATFAVIASVFLAVAAAASLLPARRALRIDPAEALRLE